MEAALRITTQVLPGHRIEITSPELNVGEQVDVVVVTERPSGNRRESILDLIDSLPAGPRSCPTWEEVERQFQQERDAWQR